MRAPCIIEGCESPNVGRGWCRAHYLRWYKTGDPLKVRKPVRGGERRHEPGEHNYTPLDTPCREWCGRRNMHGYGKIGRNGRLESVHRWVWQMAHGPIPAGMIVMHLCDNPPCFRLDHLQLGTMKDNSRDMVAKGRHRNAYSKKQVAA